MKINFKDNNLIVFFNKKIISSIDLSDNDELEDYFKKMFSRLHDVFDFDISGCYDIEVFVDDCCGAIIVIKNNDEYIDYCDIVDMKIVISKYSGFIYRVNNFCMNFDCCDLFIYKDCFYLKFNSDDFYDIGVILENCDIIFGKDANDVLLYGKRIDSDFLACLG